MEDYIGITHILEIPMNACKIDKKNNFLIIRIDELPKYKDQSFSKIIQKVEDK